MQVIYVFLAAATGIVSHKAFFIRGEHHVQAPMLLRIYAALSIILYYVLYLGKGGMGRAAVETAIITIAYAASLFASMITYRVFFHKLHQFPGPMLAPVTKLWHVSQLLKQPNFTLFDQLHHRYGDFVRTGKHRYHLQAAHV